MIPHIDGKVNRTRHKNRPFGDLPDFLRKTVARARRGCYDKNHLSDCDKALIIAKNINQSVTCHIKVIFGECFQFVPRKDYIVTVYKQIFVT